MDKDRVRLNLEINKELKKKLLHLCIDKDLSIREMIENLIDRAVKEYEKEIK